MSTSAEHLLTTIWQSLEDATSRRTGFTLGYLATVDAQGAPAARSIILRRFDRPDFRVMLATHARSAKVSEIREEPRTSLLLWDPERSVQLRLGGIARTVDDAAERARAWGSFGPGTRSLFASPVPPGSSRTDTAGSGSGRRDGRAGSDTVEAEPSPELFAWVGLSIQRMDWLDISGPEHVRWVFTRGTGSDWTGEPVVP